MKKGFFILLGVALMGMSAPSVKELCHGFVPENDLWISADLEGVAGIDEATFNAVITKVENHYRGIISAKGGNLSVRRLWSDGTVNASAQQMFGYWIVNMYGGLARHETITADGFALVMCHEVGHHIGGAPKISTGLPWASNEGQSDYFANLKCLRSIWWNDDNVQIVKEMEVEPFVERKCSETFSSDNEAAICMRGAMAGRSVANLFQALREEPEAPQFDSPDPKVVHRTDDRHPGTQCRLDTYLQGSICKESHLTDVTNTSPHTGTCTTTNGFDEGHRPHCWYKP